jgi:antitoxin CptB
VSDDRRRERLRWHCRRGMLELDLILAAAFDRHYHRFTESEIDIFERLLGMEDTVLLACLQGNEEPADFELKNFIQKIR